MLRLRSCVLAHLPSSPTTYHGSPLSRLFSAAAAAAPAISPGTGFAVEAFLLDTCGLTRAHALKASAKLSHLKSPAKPEVVLAFLAGLGLSSSDVAALVARDPPFLCASVERTLSPIVDGLTGLGLSHSEIALLVPLAAKDFRSQSVVSKVHYCLHLFGSIEKFLRGFKGNHHLLSCNLERVVKRNVRLLQECTLGACDIGKLAISMPRMLTANADRIRAMVSCAEGIGVPRGSGMFGRALRAVAFSNKEKIATKVVYLKKTLSWSDADVSTAVSKAPGVLTMSKDMLQRRSVFFISEVGLKPSYVARQPSLLSYSLEGRLRPRYYVMKFLKENRSIKRDPSYYTIAKFTEKAFVEKCICPHKEAAPQLAEDYAAACRGEVPNNFRFT